MSRGLRCAYLSLKDADISVSSAEGWLAAQEWEYYQRLRAPQRRRTWLAGRILAKRLAGAAVGDDLGRCGDPRQLTIVSRNSAGQGTRPQAYFRAILLPYSISIAHTDRGVLAAVDDRGRCDVGVDLVDRCARAAGRLDVWFTPRERACRGPASHQAELLWAIKEAVYKACNAGESFAPRRIEVHSSEGGHFDCRYHDKDVGSRGRLQIWHVDGHAAVLFMLASDTRPRAEHASPLNSSSWWEETSHPLGPSFMPVQREPMR